MWLDIPVQKAALMHFPQAVQHRQHQFQRRPPRQFSAMPFQILQQALALVVIHHQIGRPIGLEEIPHPHHVGMIELGQGSGFIQERPQPDLEQFPILLRVRRQGPPAGIPPHQIAGAILLDRYLHLQGQIEAEIGHAESARLAQGPSDQVALVQPGQRRQQQRRAWGGSVIAALGANRHLTPFVPKTARTNRRQRRSHNFNLLTSLNLLNCVSSIARQKMWNTDVKLECLGGCIKTDLAKSRRCHCRHPLAGAFGR